MAGVGVSMGGAGWLSPKASPGAYTWIWKLPRERGELSQPGQRRAQWLLKRASFDQAPQKAEDC